MTEMWLCVVCGKKTNTPHEHTLEELTDSWKNHRDRYEKEFGNG